MDKQSISRITSKSYIFNEIKFAFKTTPSTNISHPLNTEVRRICSPKRVVTINLFFSGANSRLACNENAVLTKDQLDPESKKTHVGVPKKYCTYHGIRISLGFIDNHGENASLGL